MGNGGRGGDNLAPFDKHPASPDAVRGQASRLEGLANQAVDQKAATRAAFNPAAQNWDGLAAPELRKAPEPVLHSAEDCTGALAWGAVPLNYWAAQITAFNHEVDGIVSGLSDLAGKNYGAKGTDGKPPTDSDIRNARQAAEAEARTRWNNAHNTYIVDGATTASGMFSKGPTFQNLLAAKSVGALPESPGAYSILPAKWQHDAGIAQARTDARVLQDALDGKASPDQAKAALADLRAVIDELTRNGKNNPLSAGDMAFLTTFYGALGSSVFKLPDYIHRNVDQQVTRYYVDPYSGNAYPDGKTTIKVPQFGDDDQNWMLGALGNGVLAMSNEKLGGGFNQLPQTLKDLLTKDPISASSDYEPGMSMTQYSLNRADDWKAFADMLGHSSPKIQGGEEFSRDLTYQAGEIASVAQSVDDGKGLKPSQWGYGQSMADGPLGDHGAMDDMLTRLVGASTRNHEADADVLNNSGNPNLYDPTMALMDFGWKDHGQTASHLIDWIGDARGSGDPAQVSLADRAASGLFKDIAHAEVKHDGNWTYYGNYNILMDGPGHDFRNGTDSFGMRNPAMAQALGRTVSAYLDRFGADPTGPTGLQDGKVVISEGDRIRLFTLAGTDPQAAQGLAGSVAAYEQGVGQQAAHSPGADQILLANSAARVDAYLEVGLNNGALDRTHNAETAAAQALVEKKIGFMLAKDALAAPVGLAGPEVSIPTNYLINAYSNVTLNSMTADQVSLSAQTETPPNSYGLAGLQLRTSYGEVAQLVHDHKIDPANLNRSLTYHDDKGWHLKPLNQLTGKSREETSAPLGALSDAAQHADPDLARFYTQAGDQNNNIIAHDYYSDPTEYQRRIAEGNVR